MERMKDGFKDLTFITMCASEQKEKGMRDFMTNLEKNIEELIEPIINKLGLILYDVEYVKVGKEYYLKIYVDKNENDGSVTIEDCENVTNAINDALDKADYIKEQYYLEVSSAGIEKVLKYDKHFEQNLGKKIEINLYTKFENKKRYEGILEKYTPEEIFILTDDEEISFERKSIASVKLLYDWNNIKEDEV